MFDWFSQAPDDLAERSEPSEALAVLRQLNSLTPSQLVKLNIYLVHWVPAILQRPKDREAVLELQQLCKLATALAPPNAESHRARLSAFHDLLESKRRTLKALESAQRPKLFHEEKLLQLLALGSANQSTIAGHLSVSAGRVSQILGVMEARGQVLRSKHGKENQVELAPEMVPNLRRASQPNAKSLVAPGQFKQGTVVQAVFGSLKSA